MLNIRKERLFKTGKQRGIRNFGETAEIPGLPADKRKRSSAYLREISIRDENGNIILFRQEAETLVKTGLKTKVMYGSLII